MKNGPYQCWSGSWRYLCLARIYSIEKSGYWNIKLEKLTKLESPLRSHQVRTYQLHISNFPYSIWYRAFQDKTFQHLDFPSWKFQLYVSFMWHKLYDINIKSLTKLCHQHRCGRNMIWFKVEVFCFRVYFNFPNFLKIFDEKYHQN